MGDILDAFIAGLFMHTQKVEVEVILPPNLTALDMYTIFKDAAEESGAALTGFKVIEE